MVEKAIERKQKQGPGEPTDLNQEELDELDLLSDRLDELLNFSDNDDDEEE